MRYLKYLEVEETGTDFLIESVQCRHATSLNAHIITATILFYHRLCHRAEIFFQDILGKIAF